MWSNCLYVHLPLILVCELFVSCLCLYFIGLQFLLHDLPYIYGKHMYNIYIFSVLRIVMFVNLYTPDSLLTIPVFFVCFLCISFLQICSLFLSSYSGGLRYLKMSKKLIFIALFLCFSFKYNFSLVKVRGYLL